MHNTLKNILLVILLICIALLVFFLYRFHSERADIIRDWARMSVELQRHREDTDSLRNAADFLAQAAERLQIQLDMGEEPGYYLVVDTESKTFLLKKGNIIIREGLCGVGKGFTARGSRSWNFETPKGERRVVSKKTNPAWNRPEWHWQEQGRAVPDDFITFSPSMPESERRESYRILSEREKNLVRSVPGALGRYSLGLGDGYYIHYGKGLGQAQSHGCIRVGSDDLEAIFRVLEVGDPVFIY